MGDQQANISNAFLTFRDEAPQQAMAQIYLHLHNTSASSAQVPRNLLMLIKGERQ